MKSTRSQWRTTPTETIPYSNKGSLVGYAAANWALIFAALHIVWAMGWYVGLDHELARQAFQRRWSLVYDLVAAGLCLLAFAVALALVQQWGRRLPFSMLGVLAWAGTGLLALRGVAGVAQDVYLAAVDRNLPGAGALWDVWFCLGAILFGKSVWQFWRAPRMRGSRGRAQL
jgi:hypothetical protein